MSDKRLKLPPDTAQMILKFTWGGQQCRNVFYVQKQTYVFDLVDKWEPSTWLGEDINGDAANIYASYNTHFMPLASSEVTLDGIDWVFNEGIDTGPLHEGTATTVPHAGTNTGGDLPNNATIAIKLDTGLGGRSRHGRLYFVGMGTGLVASPDFNRLKPGSVVDMNNAAAAWLNDIDTTPGIPVLGDKRNQLVVCSFVGGGLLRTPAMSTVVQQMVLHDPILDSQRRRLPGRGL